MLVDICSFLPVEPSFRARLSGWAAIPGYFLMFARGISRFCGVDEEEFLRRVKGRPDFEVGAFIEEVAARQARGASQFVLEMDEAGYDVSVVFSIDQETTTGAAPLDPQVLSDAVNECPGRLLAMIGLDPNKEDAARTLERGVKELGLHGVLLCPFLHLIPADDSAYRPIYRKCVELNVPVWIHTSVNWAQAHPMELGRPLALDRLCGEMPELKVIAGHGGWPWVPEIVAAAWRHPNLYIDPSGHRWKYLATPNSGWEMLLHFGNSVLKDKVLFGTDWPLMPMSLEEIADEARALPLKAEVTEKWMGGNAARLLDISA
ncbi:MAG: amidohydrolase family protein [Nitrospinota bacterium]